MNLTPYDFNLTVNNTINVNSINVNIKVKIKHFENILHAEGVKS